MKMMKRFLLPVVLLVVTFGLHAQQSRVFPQPNEMVFNNEYFAYRKQLRTSVLPTEQQYLNVVAPFFLTHHGIAFVPVEKTAEQDLTFVFDNNFPAEKYELTITKSGIRITYGATAGAVYALQTLLQWIDTKDFARDLQGVTITDEPRFGYRGVHLDCSRHFFTVAEIKQFLDQLSALKFNTFHWHLTDDQGWRLEIKQYPRLTEIGAWRDSTVIGHYNRSPREYEHQRYGGYYTQEEAKEIVRYAAERGITVMPEIELPGHARAALAAYPEMSCTGAALPVEGLWGVFDDVFCTQPETLQFLKNILAEVIAIFPSKTIHIGGDECPKTRWESCAKCQAVMQKNGLNDEHQLQSYVIREMEAFLNANGRELMGWDEILEGGLAANAKVMSWRGTEGGIAAAKQAHEVVMTPGSHCYFDHYQSSAPGEPLAIGGFTTLEKVYSYEPVPSELTGPEKAYILGAQANIWTEYMPDFSQVQYMAFPRLVAMSQVLWTKNKPSYEAFLPKMVEHYLPLLENNHVRYSTAFLDPSESMQPQDNGLLYTWSSPVGTVRVNGKDASDFLLEPTQKPTEYMVHIESDYQKTVSKKFDVLYTAHRLIGKPVHFITPPNTRFATHDSLGLTDGVRGALPWKGNQWLGFDKESIQFTIDLGEKETFSTIEIGSLTDEGSWIHSPKQLLVETSTDGVQFKKGKTVNCEGSTLLYRKKTSARYLKITLINHSAIPAGKPGAGHVPWTFIDELLIY